MQVIFLIFYKILKIDIHFLILYKMNQGKIISATLWIEKCIFSALYCTQYVLESGLRTMKNCLNIITIKQEYHDLKCDIRLKVLV